MSPVTRASTARRPARLARSRDDRMIAGVAGGIAQHLGVDPIVVRLVFVVLALIGGGGVIAYLVAWLVMPDAAAEDDAPSVPESSRVSVAAGLILIAVGGVALVERFVPTFSWRYVGPVVLIVVGSWLLGRKEPVA